MKYIPNTKEDISQMLKEIGSSSFEELLSQIVPENLRFQGSLNIGDSLSELDLLADIGKIKHANKTLINFNGGGVYDHYVPSVVDFIKYGVSTSMNPFSSRYFLLSDETFALRIKLSLIGFLLISK